jgi:sugar phosphate isomerase/epimerase
MTTIAPLTDYKRLCIHTITTKPWSLAECIAGYQKAGVPAITVWRQALEPQGLAESARMLKASGLEVVSLCRGGFFPATTAAGRQAAIDDNLRAIDEAHAIGAPLIVLVCGAVPDQSLTESRKQIAEGIATVAGRAAEAGVKLAIEPLHPMYADSRSAVNTLRQANGMADELALANVGVTVDVYHLWWDPELEAQIARAGAAGRIFSYHVCDWRTPTRDMLNDRGLIGEGCIPLRQIRGWVEAAGYDKTIEVEIFSEEYWKREPGAFVETIKAAYLEHV